VRKLKSAMEGNLVKLSSPQSTQARIDTITSARHVDTSLSPAPVAADPLSEPKPLTPLTDAYEFNRSFNWVDLTDSALPTHILDLVGTTMRGKPVLPNGPNQPGTVAWQIDAGVSQDVSDGVITYAFATWQHGVGVSNNPVNFGQGQGYTPFTAAQQEAGRIAIQNWDDLIAPTFVEVSGPGASVYGHNSADIVLANSYTGPAQAEAYYPGLVPYYGPTYQRVQGDVWVADPRINSSNLEFLPGQYGLQTLNHELGHSLGLSHPGSYNFGDDSDGDGVPDPINYTTDAQYFQDSNQFTIMSYFDAYETGGASIDWNVMRFIYPSTPMVDDVFVIQQKYKADMTTRAGDTTYGWNATADVTNEAMIFQKGDLISAFTIWDAAGNDTLDLSGYYTDSVIDLREGAYSSAGGWGAYEPTVENLDLASMDPMAALAIIDANNAALGLSARTRADDFAYGADYIYQLYINGQVQARDDDGELVFDDNGDPVYLNEGLSWAEITGAGSDFLMENNIGIAYGAVIENAVGGHGNDRINGNYVDNRFTGNDGADTFIIADHIATLPTLEGGTRTVTDNSTDTITDFDSAEGDRIDLSSFDGVTFDNITQHYDASTHDLTLTIDRAVGNDVQLILENVSSVSAGDFLFG
jgi:hypothetical protein